MYFRSSPPPYAFSGRSAANPDHFIAIWLVM
jgi:hypothetical protein